MKCFTTILFDIVLMFSLHNLFKYYSTDKLAETREILSHKICFRKQLSFLKYRISLTQSMSNRLVVNSNYLRSYKNLREYYLLSLKATFSPFLLEEYKPYTWKNFDNKDFLLAFSQDLMMHDLDYALLWRGAQTNSLFTIRSKRIKKKKKQFFYQHRPIFISGFKRLLFVWKWLSVLIRSCHAKGTKRKYSLIPGLENFLMAPTSSQLLNAYKLHIYKIKLMRVM